MEVSFLKFIQIAYKCQVGGNAGRNPEDHHHIWHTNFTDEETRVQRKEITCLHHRVIGTVGTRIQLSCLAIILFPLHYTAVMMRGYLFFSESVIVQLLATSWTLLCLGSYVLGILQARIQEWVAIPFSRGSSWPRVSCFAGRFFTIWCTRELSWR